MAGIGSFTIVDGAEVTEGDLGNNFFLESGSVGKPRAQCVTELLRELNEHVSGSYIAEDISEVLSARPSFFRSFTLVIATQMTQGDLKTVASVCAEHGIPLMTIHSYGFLGYLRLDLGEHSVSPPRSPWKCALRDLAPDRMTADSLLLLARPPRQATPPHTVS